MNTIHAESVDRTAIAENVTEDSGLSPGEKETTIRFDKRDADATVFTAEAGLMRRLVAHPEATITRLNILDGGARRAGVDPSDYDAQPVVGITVTLPVAGLQVKKSARKNPQHAEVVTDRVLGNLDNGGGDA